MLHIDVSEYNQSNLANSLRPSGKFMCRWIEISFAQVALKSRKSKKLETFEISSSQNKANLKWTKFWVICCIHVFTKELRKTYYDDHENIWNFLIIKSEKPTINYCLGFCHETMVYVVSFTAFLIKNDNTPAISFYVFNHIYRHIDGLIQHSK